MSLPLNTDDWSGKVKSSDAPLNTDVWSGTDGDLTVAPSPPDTVPTKDLIKRNMNVAVFLGVVLVIYAINLELKRV